MGTVSPESGKNLHTHRDPLRLNSREVITANCGDINGLIIDWTFFQIPPALPLPKGGNTPL